MSSQATLRAELPSESRPPVYRVILLAGSGVVSSVRRISADDDDQARESARAMVDGHAVELWDGLRFIDHFAPIA